MFKKSMKIGACILALLVFLSPMTFGQGAGVSLTGTITDTTGGVVVGAVVIARNVDTGIETRTTSNDRGAYNFPSLPPAGAYEIIVEAPGFQRTMRPDTRFSVGQAATLNFTLNVAGSVVEVDVTAVTDSVILDAGTSTGTVLHEEILSSVPMLSNNVMDLINLMGGVIPAGDPSMSPAAQQFGGITAANVNVTLDGITMNEVRQPSGVTGAMNVNPDMIGEFRMVLSPVDAEFGRGAGQVQMTTRSGSNAFRGSGTWNIQNTALDAIDFSQKVSGATPHWRNMNNYLLSGSGPIIRDRTFIFATWEQQISRVKYDYTARAFSTCARVGIYRYIGGATPGVVTDSNSFNPANDIRPTVDADGNILDRQSGAQFLNNLTREMMSFDQAHPSTLRGQGMRPGDGELMFESVFGPLTDQARQLIASDVRNVFDPCTAFANSGLWDPMNGQFGVSEPWDTRPWEDLGAASNRNLVRTYRHAYDPTGYAHRFINGVQWNGINVVMPPVNYFRLNGDGLNVASHRFTRRSVGGREGSIYGAGSDADRRSITLRVDHNINSEHRLSGTYIHENFETDANELTWPEEYGGFGGMITRRPRTANISLTSTLRPTLLNEFRFGYLHSRTYEQGTVDYNPEIPEILNLLMPFENTGNQMMITGIGAGLFDAHLDEATYNWAGHPVGSRGNIPPNQGDQSFRWTFANTMTWMRGAHSFRGGVEFRYHGSSIEKNGTAQFGRWWGGATVANTGVTQFPVTYGGLTTTGRRAGTLLQHDLTRSGQNWRNLPASGDTTDRDTQRHPLSDTTSGWIGNTGSAGGTILAGAYDLQTYFSGSINRVAQWFFAVPGEGGVPRWNDSTNPNEQMYTNEIYQRELGVFFKDDWRVNSSLTLNLGVRWDYYGVPHAADGKTLALVGSNNIGIFGNSVPHTDFERRMYSGNRQLQPEYQDIPFGYLGNAGAVHPSIAGVTSFEYIGPGSINPNRMAWNRDLNNFAPHLGFAWQLPWFGRGMTTLRGGWSISHNSFGSTSTFADWIAEVTAANPVRAVHFTGLGMADNFTDSLFYMDLTDLDNRVTPLTGDHAPMPGRVRGAAPMIPTTMSYFAGPAITMTDENIKNPITHSLNVSLTRNIGRALTLDVRYIGTLGRQSVGTYNLNENNHLNTRLAWELDRLRREPGYESDLINSLVPSLGATTGGGYAANALLRGLSGSRQMVHENGAGSNLAQLTYGGVAGTIATGNGGFGTGIEESARLFRAGCLPEQRQNPNGDLTDHVGNPCLYHTPLNLFMSNAQHGGGASLRTNTKANSDYHSMQTQLTLRPTHGLNFQATWTWARQTNNGNTNAFTGERLRNLGNRPLHQLNIFGSYELPFGPRGYLFRESSSLVRKIVEGWQLSWVTSLRGGPPLSITGATPVGYWGNNYPILVRPDLWDDKSGRGTDVWTDEGRWVGGRYWGDKYTRVMDPGVCNPIRDGGNMLDELYDRWCLNPVTGLMNTTGNMRALALQDQSRIGEVDPFTNAPYAMRYTEADIAALPNGMTADGMRPNVGDPIIVFRNATGSFDNNATFDPNLRGNYNNNKIRGLGSWTFDMSMAKSVEFMEGKRLEVRVDAANIMNKAMLSSGSPRYQNGGRLVTRGDITNLGINTTGAGAVGNLTTKVGHRTFQARIRLSF